MRRGTSARTRSLSLAVTSFVLGITAACGGSTATAPSTGTSGTISADVRGPTSDGGGGSGTTPDSTASSSSTGGGPGAAGTGSFTLSGAVSGQLTGPYFDLQQNLGEGAACGRQPNGRWVAEFGPAALNGGPPGSSNYVNITDAHYSGPGSFTRNANDGDVAVTVGIGGQQWTTGAAKVWAVTINSDEKSGTVHAELEAGQTDTTTVETVDGTFSCP